MAMLEVKELANYISEEYSLKFNKKISPVRMQKTLYFIFAYWGGFVRKGKNSQTDNQKEIDVNSLDEILFDNKIEAWVYGPVIPEVYHEKNIDVFLNNNLFDGNELLKEVVDSVLEDTFQVNDFKLVDISHCDDAWKKHFHHEQDFHNEEIPKEEIISEYEFR